MEYIKVDSMTLDDLARFNQERWDDLARSGVEYARPYLDMDDKAARELVDPEGFIGDARGLDVLCLAAGGGQQTAAFGLLGANVTCIDLSGEQLERDRTAAKHYGLDVRTVQGDMRDLSALGESAFDVVWHGHSLNFVPDARVVFGQVRRALREGGLYCLSCVNPYFHGISEEDWNGDGYPLRNRYVEGEVFYSDGDEWTFTAPDGSPRRVQGPREFRHSMETLLNGPIGLGFELLRMREIAHFDPEAELEPGTWDHLQSVAPPYLGFWWRYGLGSSVESSSSSSP